MTREEAIARIKDHMSVHKYEERAVKITEALNMAISALQQPEIVRCRECTRFDKKRGCNLVEGLNVAKTDSFCSYAERKEGEA